MDPLILGLAPVFLLSSYICQINLDLYESLIISSRGTNQSSKIVYSRWVNPNGSYKSLGSHNLPVLPIYLPNNIISIWNFKPEVLGSPQVESLQVESPQVGHLKFCQPKWKSKKDPISAAEYSLIVYKKSFRAHNCSLIFLKCSPFFHMTNQHISKAHNNFFANLNDI